jgi:zinc/manganese transport system substrate-binding protein
MRLTQKTGILIAGAALAALVLAGCSSPAAGADSSAPTKLSIVASTNVWGDVARRIAGDDVTVSSIISDPSQDPHSYEANAQVQLSLSKADIVIENGGGYDDFVDTLLKSANNSKATVLNAVTISGLEKAGSELNEHVWYDFPTVKKVAARITASLVKLDPSSASDFRANQKTFDAALAKLQSDEAAIKASSSAGAGVAITEPVPLYLLEASGLVNKTPAAFSKAIEDGTDVAPDVLRKTLALFGDHTVKLLAYNEQTSGPETEQVLAAAKAAKVAIVPVTETLPKGKDYLGWMTDNIAAITAALK